MTDIDKIAAGAIERFHIALVRAEGGPKWINDLNAETEHNAAFHYAKVEAGWHDEYDEEFMTFALKATPCEILIEGLRRTLNHLYGGFASDVVSDLKENTNDR